MPLEAIKYANGSLKVLDQLLLPFESKYIDIKTVEDGWKAINSMQVRGAPAIALVGCLSLVVELQKEKFQNKSEFLNEVTRKLNYLVSARPTAVNIKKSADHLISLAESFHSDAKLTIDDAVKRFVGTIEDMLKADIADNQAIGKYGADAILMKTERPNDVIILTHCNTGSLATAGFGTALGVVRELRERGSLSQVFFTETRPYMQGARLTAYELLEENIPSTLICDNMVAALFRAKSVTAVVVGADRVAANGDTANKIGTYQIAVLAKHHHVPFYIAAPYSSIDFNIPNGESIPIEERPEHEVTSILGIQCAAPGVKCWNPSFDVTPAELISGIITEKGVFPPSQILH